MTVLYYSTVVQYLSPEGYSSSREHSDEILTDALRSETTRIRKYQRYQIGTVGKRTLIMINGSTLGEVHTVCSQHQGCLVKPVPE